MGFEPQTNVCLATVPITDVLVTSPGPLLEATIFGIPRGANLQVELLSVTYVAETLPVDGANLQFDLEVTDDSNSQAVTALASAFTMDDNRTAQIGNQVWRGSRIMEAGDTLNLQYDTDQGGTITTAGQGVSVVVEYRVLRHS